MTLALMRGLLTRRLRSPLRAILLLAVAAQDLSQVPLSGQADAAEGVHAGLATLVLGLGMIAQERGDGSLALLLTRPVSRAKLVLSAWLAASLAGLAAWLSLCALRLSLSLLPSVEAVWSARDWRLEVLSALGSTVGMAAVLVTFGTMVRGPGAIASQGLATWLFLSVQGAARESGWPWLERIATELLRLVLPVPQWRELLAPGGWSWFDVLSSLSNVALLLCLACWLLSRLQLSYSSGD